MVWVGFGGLRGCPRGGGGGEAKHRPQNAPNTISRTATIAWYATGTAGANEADMVTGVCGDLGVLDTNLALMSNQKQIRGAKRKKKRRLQRCTRYKRVRGLRTGVTHGYVVVCGCAVCVSSRVREEPSRARPPRRQRVGEGWTATRAPI